MTSSRCDVLVVGGGPAGAACALVAARSGLSTILVDARDGTTDAADHGRAVALLAGTRDRLIDLALWEMIAPAVHPLDRVRVQNATSGHEHLYRAHDLGRTALFHGIAYSDLRARLAAGLADATAVDHRHKRRLTALHLEAGWRRARLDDGSTIHARLVVGADGRRSTVRETVGLSARRTDYPQSALIFAVEGRGLEHDTVLERMTPEGPVSILPLGPERFAVTWVDGAGATQRRRELGSGDLMQELASVLAMAALRDLRLATPPTVQRLGLTHADRYVAPRLVLMGDAAHGAHPVHAQGFNMAIGDVHELAMLWRVEGKRFASAETLARYQRNRRLANAARLGLTDVVNRLFGEATAPWAFLHGSVTNAVADEEALPAPPPAAREARPRRRSG
jgi:2-octaprenyl-6-methoxyphenol hydroxylase